MEDVLKGVTLIEVPKKQGAQLLKGSLVVFVDRAKVYAFFIRESLEGLLLLLVDEVSKKLAAIVNELKVAIYIRVSTRWQVDKDSLPLQREDLPKYAELVLGIKKYEIFEDAGYSAKNTDRPAYQRMMARVRSGEFSHILVWKIDRISRNLIDFASMYQELKDYGITFVSKNEQYISDTALCITDPDGDGLYYYNYYDRSLESVVFALTDYEYTKANKQKYSNADLYSYRTERV